MLKVLSGMLPALFLAGSVQAQEIVGWRQDVGGWTIAVDRTIDNSCFMIAKVDTDVLMRFQFNAAREDVQMIIANTRWDALEDGRTFPVVVTLGDGSPWEGLAQSKQWKDVLPSLVLSVSGEDRQAVAFVEQFSRIGRVRVSTDGSEIVSLSLEGTQEAVREMMACQQSMATCAAEDGTAACRDEAT